jgi:multiple sugar transport system permease protein
MRATAVAAGRAGTARHRLAGLVFCAPLVLLLAGFVGYPVARLGYYSLTRYDGLSAPEWVGLENYRFLLTWPDFGRILLNNTVLLAGVALWVVVPFVVSVTVFGMRRADLIRAFLFVPALLPPVIVGGMFRIVLADDGILNAVPRAVGLDALALPWLSSQRLVLLTVILVIGWATLGSGVLFYSAGLAALSPSYVEAATMDGASWRQLLWHIYRPALRPVTRFWMLLLTVTTVTGFFPWIYGLTLGGPGIASTTLDYQIFVTLNQGTQLGRGAAVAVIGMILVAGFVLLQVVFRRIRVAEEWRS